GSDENDVALLDMRQESVLLSLVKAMNLVHEHDRARTATAGECGFFHHSLHFLDPAEHGAEGNKVTLAARRDDGAQRGLADAGRAPQDERGDLVALDLR